MSIKRRIVIVDDHPIVRQGFSQLINQEADLEICGEAEDANGALAMAERAGAELMLVDLSLKNSSGIELIKSLSLRFPRLPILVISLHEENIYAERAIRAGARGFVMKVAPTGELLAAIRRVLEGGVYLSPQMQERLVQRMVLGSEREASPARILSDRELEIFELIGNGMGTRDIAAHLSLGVKTVETHKAHIKAKLGSANANELMRAAVEWGMRQSGNVEKGVGENLTK